MKRVAVTGGLGAAMILLVALVAADADAQWRYTDDQGTPTTTQYKLNIPERSRDSAVWIGPTGVGHPALSEEQRRWKQRGEAYRQLGRSQAELLKHQR
jgi:hypothetical protein